MNKDPHRFIHWMKNQCQANAGHAKKTSDVVKALIFDENHSSHGNNRRVNGMAHENGDGRKKFNLSTPKSLLKSTNAQMIGSDGRTSSSNNNKMILQTLKIPLTASKMNSVMKSEATGHGTAIEDNDSAKDALNQHLSKLRGQFSNVHDSANQKMLELQSEIGKMVSI